MNWIAKCQLYHFRPSSMDPLHTTAPRLYLAWVFLSWSRRPNNKQVAFGADAKCWKFSSAVFSAKGAKECKWLTEKQNSPSTRGLAVVTRGWLLKKARTAGQMLADIRTPRFCEVCSRARPNFFSSLRVKCVMVMKMRLHLAVSTSISYVATSSSAFHGVLALAAEWWWRAREKQEQWRRISKTSTTISCHHDPRAITRILIPVPCFSSRDSHQWSVARILPKRALAAISIHDSFFQFPLRDLVIIEGCAVRLPIRRKYVCMKRRDVCCTEHSLVDRCFAAQQVSLLLACRYGGFWSGISPADTEPAWKLNPAVLGCSAGHVLILLFALDQEPGHIYSPCMTPLK